jgi:drug/metabolite transporter (DMT)-like permease
MSTRWIAYLELSLAMTIVGSSVVVGKIITAHIPVFLASTLRLAIGLPLLVLLTHQAKFDLRKLKTRDYLALFLQALTGIFLFNVLLLYGLHYTTATNSGIITSLTPAVFGIISWLFLKERLSLSVWGGIILAVCGVLAINVLGATPHAEQGSAPLLGNLLVFVAVIGEVLFTIFRKLTAKRISPLENATLVTIFGLLIFLPLGLYEAASFDFRRISTDNLLALLYYGFGVTTVAYILWFSGVEKVPASTAAVFTGVLPVSTVILSVLFLGEQGTTAHLVGLACVLGGIGLIARSEAT